MLKLYLSSSYAEIKFSRKKTDKFGGKHDKFGGTSETSIFLQNYQDFLFPTLLLERAVNFRALLLKFWKISHSPRFSIIVLQKKKIPNYFLFVVLFFKIKKTYLLTGNRGTRLVVIYIYINVLLH